MLCRGPQTQAQVSRADQLAGPATKEPRPHCSIIKVNPLSLLVSSFSAFYEHGLANHLSVVVGYGSAGRDFGFSNQTENDKYRLRRGTVEVRRYWSRSNNPLGGWYAGPYLRAGTVREFIFVNDPPGQHTTGRWQANTAFVWVPGVMSGYQMVKRRVAVDAYLGLQAQVVAGTLVGSNTVVEGLTSTVAVRAGFAVGLPF